MSKRENEDGVVNTISRYRDPRIEEIFSPEQRLSRFDQVEIAAVLAEFGKDDERVKRLIEALKNSPPNEERRKEIERVTDHDLMAYVMQRWEILPPELQAIFHKAKTSFDIQDPADQLALIAALDAVIDDLRSLMEITRNQGLKYWYSPLLLRTHGQGAHVGTFGKRLSSYFADLEFVQNYLLYARKMISFGKMSGLVGDYQNASYQIEYQALKMLGLKPYYGASQILPRSMHAILASSLTVLCGVLAKIAEDFQLMARNPRPLIQEPFKIGQTGSSASPAKKNSIKSENTEGMFRLALGDLVALLQNLITKEERDIAQSSVERVALIDLFHISLNALKNVSYVMENMAVYPVHMLDEILEMCGTEAAEAAKEFLVENGIPRETAYAIVKQASHNAFNFAKIDCLDIPTSPQEAELFYRDYAQKLHEKPDNIRDIIAQGRLFYLPTVNVGREAIKDWNTLLRGIFADQNVYAKWEKVFDIEHIFASQEVLLEKMREGAIKV